MAASDNHDRGHMEISEQRATYALFGDLVKWKDRKSTRLNSSHIPLSRMPSSA